MTAERNVSALLRKEPNLSDTDIVLVSQILSLSKSWKKHRLKPVGYTVWLLKKYIFHIFHPGALLAKTQ